MTPFNVDSAADASAARDLVIEAYKKDVDRTLLRDNLKLSVEDRFRRFESFMHRIAALPEGTQWPVRYERIDLMT